MPFIIPGGVAAIILAVIAIRAIRSIRASRRLRAAEEEARSAELASLRAQRQVDAQRLLKHAHQLAWDINNQRVEQVGAENEAARSLTEAHRVNGSVTLTNNDVIAISAALRLQAAATKLAKEQCASRHKLLEELVEYTLTHGLSPADVLSHLDNAAVTDWVVEVMKEGGLRNGYVGERQVPWAQTLIDLAFVPPQEQTASRVGVA